MAQNTSMAVECFPCTQARAIVTFKDERREQRLAKGHMSYIGYHRSGGAKEDAELTHVGPGTPCGEYLRRFWQPVCMAEQLTELPLALRIMGEDLVAFRDLSGNVGLLHRQCSHRRTSLEYGVIAEHGIRCCYHGWLFDVDGRILETPGEPENSPIKDSLHHGAYPALEYKGLVFAYLGPPAEKPEFPVYDTMDLPGDELVPYTVENPCNWLQVQEQPIDPIHSVFLHTRVTGTQFADAWGELPELAWRQTDDNTGIYVVNCRRWHEHVWVRHLGIVLPNLFQPPDLWQDPDREKMFTRAAITAWVVPVDDMHCVLIGWRHYNDELDLAGRGDRTAVGANRVDFVGQTGARSYEGAQRVPGDYEVMHSQGSIALHKLEHLGQTDIGVAMLRRMIRRAIRDLKKGRGPPRRAPNKTGQIPTISSDVIVKFPDGGPNERAARRAFGLAVSDAVVDTLALPHLERRGEIERRVLKLTAETHRSP